MAIYDTAYIEVRGKEGGYANDPDDPGGETYSGVARKRWPGWAGWKHVDRHKALTKSHSALNQLLANDAQLQKLVKDFYFQEFWLKVRCDILGNYSEDLAIDVFDMAVNLGQGRAVEFIQRSCNALNNRQRDWPDIRVDGAFGPRTLAALESCIAERGVKLLYKLLNILQGAWYVQLMEGREANEKYLGWFSRVDFI